MKKTVLVLTGSPRKGGNSDMMADAFTKGALSAGHEVLRFDSARNLVKGCTACNACWSKDKPCIFEDGFDVLAPMLEKADVLVLCSPVYWFTVTAQMKAALDKFYAYISPRCPRKLKLRESVLLMCAGDTDPAVFNGSVATYKGAADYLGLKEKGMLLVNSAMDKGDILKTDGLVRAERLGSEL